MHADMFVCLFCLLFLFASLSVCVYVCLCVRFVWQDVCWCVWLLVCLLCFVCGCLLVCLRDLPIGRSLLMRLSVCMLVCLGVCVCDCLCALFV